MLEARAQTRLANLSTDAIHVVDRGAGHFIPERDPAIVLAAVRANIDRRRCIWPADARRFEPHLLLDGKIA